MKIVYSRKHTVELRARWIRIEFSQSFSGQPVRPLLRLQRAEGTITDHILPAAAFGRARWIGLAPPDLVSLEIVAALAPSQEMRIDRLVPYSEAQIAGAILTRRPFRFLNYLMTRSKGPWQRGVMARTAFDLKRITDYTQFTSERQRPLEAGGLDAALFRPKAEVGELGFVLAATNPRDFDHTLETLRSLSRQSDKKFRLMLAHVGILPGGISKEVIRLGLGPQTTLVHAPGEGTSDLVALTQAQHLASDWVALLKPGDSLDSNAVLIVRDYLNEHLNLQVLYTDSAEVDRWTGVLLPQLKPDWSPTFLEQVDYVRRPCFYRRNLLASALPSIREEDVNPGWSLLATVTADQAPAAIGHLKRVLLQSPPRAAVDVRAFRLPPFPIDDRPLDERPVVSIIVPTRDRVDLLQRLIESLSKKTQTDLLYEVIIVDNDSNLDKTKSYLSSLIKDRKFSVVNHTGFFNFSNCINAGVAKSRGDVLLFMNNDCEAIFPNWFDRLVSLAIQPEIGAVGALLLFEDSRIQHAGVSLGLGGAAGHRDRNMRLKAHYGHLLRLRAVHETSAVTGACLAVSRDKFDEIGGLDPAFAVAFNDIDFCVRLQARGYRNLLDPGAILKHLESASRGKDAGAKRERFDKEAALFRNRWPELVQDDPFFHPLFSTSRFNDWLE